MFCILWIIYNCIACDNKEIWNFKYLPTISPSQANCGVYIGRNLKKINCIIAAAHCCMLLLYPMLQRSWKGGILVSPCLSVDRIASTLYLQQFLWDPFHICTSYRATSEGVSRVMFVWKFKNLKFWRILEICNFDFVSFWLGIQYDSMVWVIMQAF